MLGLLGARALFRDDNIERNIMRGGSDAVDGTQFEADTDRQRAGSACRQRAVEVATAVAQSVAGGVEGHQRQQHDIGHGDCVGDRYGDAVRVGRHWCIRPPGAELHGRRCCHNDRHGGAPAGVQELSDQCAAIHLGTDWPAEGNDANRVWQQQVGKVVENPCAGSVVVDSRQGHSRRDLFLSQRSAESGGINGKIAGLIGHGAQKTVC